MANHDNRIKTWVRERSPFTIGLRLYAQIARIVIGAPLLQYSRIYPWLYVGGQHRARGWSILQQEGITAIINLRQEFDDKGGSIPSEHYLHLAVQDNHAPSLEQLHQGVSFIREQIENGGKVYIHCGVGVGRAPTMAAAYLVSEGLTPKEAWRVIRMIRPFILPVRSQIIRVEQFAKEL